MFGVYIGNERVLVESSVGSKVIVPSNEVKAVSELMCNGMYDETLTLFLIKSLRGGNKVLDLGAGFGYFSVLCCALVGENGQVVALEENENNIKILNENLVINNMKNRVSILGRNNRFGSEFIANFDYVRISKEYSNVFVLDEIKRNFIRFINTKFILEIYDNDIKDTYIEFINDISKEHQCSINFIGESNQLKSIDIGIMENVDIKNSVYIIIENEENNPIREIFEEIDRENNIDENIKKLNDIYINDLEKINLNNNDVEILNKIAIYNYKTENYNYVIPYLNAAYTLDNKDVNTLYNLSSVLYNVGELELALNYISQIDLQDMDDEIRGFKEQIKSELI